MHVALADLSTGICHSLKMSGVYPMEFAAILVDMFKRASFVMASSYDHIVYSNQVPDANESR